MDPREPEIRDSGFDLVLSWTYGWICYFSFGGRTEIAHEMAVELESGINLESSPEWNTL